MYTIIEDCSPYYIRFTHNGVDKVLDYFLGLGYNFDDLLAEKNMQFLHYAITIPEAEEGLKLIPMNNLFNFKKKRVSYFVSKAGLYYPAHKDSAAEGRFGINYGLKILDDKCITSWYDEQELSPYPEDPDSRSYLRGIIGFDKSKHLATKTVTAVQGEVMLFNTNIFHDWDNSNSPNTRTVLTLRPDVTINSDQPEIFFEDARQIIFGY